MVTEQVAVVPGPALSVQLAPPLNATVPVGIDLAGVSVSVTVALQLVGLSTATLAGKQARERVVEGLGAVSGGGLLLVPSLGSALEGAVSVRAPTGSGVKGTA